MFWDWRPFLGSLHRESLFPDMSTPQHPQRNEATLTPDRAFVNQGGTVRPVYGERRPVMYHLFDTEMRSISGFNGEALRWFSIGSFCLNCVLAIVIDYAYATAPLSEFGKAVLYKVAPFLGVIVIGSFGFAIWALCQKKALIDQIKRETRTESTSVQL
jgi:hypothetical protein